MGVCCNFHTLTFNDWPSWGIIPLYRPLGEDTIIIRPPLYINIKAIDSVNIFTPSFTWNWHVSFHLHSPLVTLQDRVFFTESLREFASQITCLTNWYTDLWIPTKLTYLKLKVIDEKITNLICSIVKITNLICSRTKQKLPSPVGRSIALHTLTCRSLLVM